MRYIIAATAFAFVAGITLGFILSDGLGDSASAAPRTRAVEEQNLDGSGFIAVHEQGIADVNVVSMPSQDLGPLEFTHLQVSLCSSPTGFCVPGASDSVDVDGILTGLSSQGWRLVETNSGAPGGSLLILYTLSRPVP